MAELDQALRAELLAMADEDQRVRAELAADGSLFDGYHPSMEAVHARNAARLAEILDRRGWPGRSLAGEDGAQAAWQVLQHAIGLPPLQRRGLELLRAAAEAGEVPAWQVAMLEDRIRTFEGRPQRYGTQFDWDRHGRMAPLPIEDPDGLEERRRAVGLEPLAQRVRAMRQSARREGERAPQDWAARQREMDQWARKAGWRT
jgi:hypothetical protein